MMLGMAIKASIRNAVEHDLLNRRNRTISEIAKEHGRSYWTVYRWHEQLKQEGRYDAPKEGQE